MPFFLKRVACKAFHSPTTYENRFHPDRRQQIRQAHEEQERQDRHNRQVRQDYADSLAEYDRRVAERQQAYERIARSLDPLNTNGTIGGVGGGLSGASTGPHRVVGNSFIGMGFGLAYQAFRDSDTIESAMAELDRRLPPISQPAIPPEIDTPHIDEVIRAERNAQRPTESQVTASANINPESRSVGVRLGYRF